MNRIEMYELFSMRYQESKDCYEAMLASGSQYVYLCHSTLLLNEKLMNMFKPQTS